MKICRYEWEFPSWIWKMYFAFTVGCWRNRQPKPPVSRIGPPGMQ